MQIIDRNRTDSTFLYFDSLSSIANVQVDPLNEETWKGCMTYDRNNETWFGLGGGRAEVREVCELYGWDRGVKRGLETIGKLEAPKLPSIKRRRCKASYGHSLDIARLYSGDFERMWNSSRRELSTKKMSKKGLVNLVVDITANSGTSADRFFWRGALACIMARALQESGRKVRLLSGFSIRGHVAKHRIPAKERDKVRGTDNLTVITQVKRFDQPVEYNSMFAITALAGFFRHYGFKSILSIPFPVSGGLGRASRVEVKNFDYILDDNPVLIIENVWDEHSAMRRSQTLIEELEA